MMLLSALAATSGSSASLGNSVTHACVRRLISLFETLEHVSSDAGTPAGSRLCLIRQLRELCGSLSSSAATE